MSESSLSARSSLDSLRGESLAGSVISAPDTLAPAVTGPMVWEGTQLRDYVVYLSPAEVDSIRAAVLSFKLSGLDRSAIDASTFPLDAPLAKKLRTISQNIHSGSGIAVLRGLDTARFNDTEAVIAFAGISSHVCALRACDSYANQALSHIRDATHDRVPSWAEKIGLAGSKINSAMEFHSDRFSGDVLTMHVRNDGGAQDGGEQYVASFSRIYNELLETEPAVLETMLAEDWPFELKQKDSEPYLEPSPTLFFSKGKPICQLVKAPLLGSPRIPRDPKMPSLSVDQMHALDVVEGLAKRFSAKLDRKQGDIQFLNNLGVMHARAAYGNEKRSSRHLLRMFLRDPENEWDKPARYSHKFDDPFMPGRRQELPIIDSDPYRKISGRDSHG